MPQTTIESTKPATQFPGRRKFLELPMEERRLILTEQAKLLLSCYEQDTERIDLQGTDIVEY